jgi:uncharacterized damage-inducible protein DinB
MRPTFIEDSFGHHVWATLRLIDACQPLTDEQLARKLPGTYGSILDTMRHLVSADSDYLALLTGGRVETHDEVGDLAELRAVMVADGEAWKELLASNPDPGMIVARRREDGSESRVALGLRLAQAVQHGTDHRSQICTALTSLGIEPPSLDVWSFAGSEGRVEVVEPAP